MKFKSKYPWLTVRTQVMPLLVLTLLLSTSCIREQIFNSGGKTGEGEALVTLSLSLPANVAPQTRSLTAPQEDAVNNLWVLAFEPNGGNYSYMAKCVNSGSSYKATLRTGNWDLVLVANAENILTTQASLLTKTNSKSTVLNGLTLENTSKWNATHGSTGYVSIPMCSDPEELKNKAISEQSPIMSVGPVAMYRMLARVNVTLGSKGGVNAKDNFAITSVHFYNRNTKGNLKPDRSAATTDPAVVNEFSTGSYGVLNHLEYSGSEIGSGASGTSCTNEIYVFEVNNTNASGLELTTRPCLVVGGTYKGATNYYRVDFSTGSAGAETYLDILRNHSYNVNISAVNGPGFLTPEEAFNSLPINITAEVIPWNETTLDNIVFNGQYYIQYSHREVHFLWTGVASTENVITVKTNVPSFTLGNFTDITKGAGDDPWAESTPGTWSNGHLTATISDPSIVGEEKSYTITITAAAATAGDPARETTFTATGANVVAKLKIIQDILQVNSFPAYSGVIGYDNATGQLVLDGDGTGDDGKVMMYFKFGSVVGVTANTSGDNAWNNSHLKFNPMTNQSAITGYGSNSSTLPNIPGYVSANDGNGSVEGFISSTTYHNSANVLNNGKGDPCKLVGLTKEQINSGTVDNGQWHMPTSIENANFAGLSGASISTFSDTNFPYYANSSGTKTSTAGTATSPARGYFPIGGGTRASQTTGRSFNSSGTYLPAAGLRNPSGVTGGVGYSGYYWSGTPLASANAYDMSFGNSSLYVRGDDNYTYAMPIRCVKNLNAIPASPAYVDVLSMDENGELNLDGKGQVLYFKWGSLIGLSTDPTIPGTSVDVIVYTPEGYDIENNPFTKYKFIPYANGATFPATQNPAAGIGDPCKLAYKGGVGIGVGNYKTPSGKPFQGFPSGTIDNGNTVGTAKYTWNTGSTTDLANLSTGIFNLTGDAATAFGATMVLPAAGHRGTDGTVGSQGYYGYYWSSTPNTISNGYYLSFLNTLASPNYGMDRQCGFAVRCVRE